MLVEVQAVPCPQVVQPNVGLGDSLPGAEVDVQAHVGERGVEAEGALVLVDLVVVPRHPRGAGPHRSPDGLELRLADGHPGAVHGQG